MKITTNKRFRKAFRKRIERNKSVFKKFVARRKIFQIDRSNPVLRDHSLSGSMRKYRSFWITGDVRVIYEIIDNEIVFVDIGTHAQVYK